MIFIKSVYITDIDKVTLNKRILNNLTDNYHRYSICLIKAISLKRKNKIDILNYFLLDKISIKYYFALINV